MTLELRDVAFNRTQRSVLDGISFTLGAGATGVVTGETGAGKSSLLRLIAGLTPPASGTITFEGQLWNSPTEAIPSELRPIGMVFQDLALWPHLRVAEQIDITLHPLGRGARRERTAQVMDALGIADVAARYPGEISGGQQQRVAIGRALARRPRLALLDEPTNQLDRSTAEHVSQWLRSEQITTGRILVVVTHDMEIGRMLGVGTPGGTAWKLAGGKLQPIAGGASSS